MGHRGLPTWRLLVDAARSLDPTGSTPFRSRDLIARVQVLDPTRQSGSITTILQGMTANASGGPKSACGDVFWRVDRGLYRYVDAESSAQGPPKREPAPPPLRRTRDEPPPLPHPIANEPDDSFSETGTVVLVGCVSSKRATPAKAKDLYTSALFRKRRAYAEQSGHPWFILSAEYGLIHPDQPIAPYDRSLQNESRNYVNDWAAKVAALVVSAVSEAGANVVEIHAGSAYLPTSLRRALEASNIRIDYPVEGLRIGEHMAWYSKNPQPPTQRASSRRPAEQAARVSEQPIDDLNRRAIAKRLATETDSVAGLLIPLADDPAADDFIKRDAFAFLVAVIADYQVKAEWAWRLPYDLASRLGGLSPERVLLHADATIRAFRDPTPLHRFPDQTAAWVVDAAERVMDRYEGDAANIWNDTPTATELQRRLEAFKGISQKKAAMAVEILERIIGIEIAELGGSDIAYDVHVRRVFLRSGLAAHDDVRAMVRAARELWPERPGSLDAAAWHIGRTWCRPTYPLCDDCLLADICPRLVAAAESVRGA